MHMKGTSHSATAPMRRMPPSTTAPVSTMSTMPVIQVSTPKALCTALAMPLAWTMLPMPKPASPPKIAKAVPSQRHCLGEAVLDGEHGAAGVLALVVHLAELHGEHDFAVFGGHADEGGHHIRTGRRGRPGAMAVATPAMLPVPTVADRAVMSAAKGEISPSARAAGVAALPDHAETEADLEDGHEARRICR